MAELARVNVVIKITLFVCNIVKCCQILNFCQILRDSTRSLVITKRIRGGVTSAERAMDMSRTAGLAPIRRDRDRARPTAVTPKMLPFSTFGCRKSKNRKWRRWPNQVKFDSSDVLPAPTIIPERLGEIRYKIFFRTMFAPSVIVKPPPWKRAGSTSSFQLGQFT